MLNIVGLLTIVSLLIAPFVVNNYLSDLGAYQLGVMIDKLIICIALTLFYFSQGSGRTCKKILTEILVIVSFLLFLNHVGSVAISEFPNTETQAFEEVVDGEVR